MTQPHTNEEPETAPTSFDDIQRKIISSTAHQPVLSIFDLPIFQRKAFFLFLGCVIGIIVHWKFTAEIFVIPSDVAHARAEFFAAKEQYEKSSHYWDIKQQHLVQMIQQETVRDKKKEKLAQCHDISTELLVSFLIQKLEVNPKRLEQLTLYPKKALSNFSLILSKYEYHIWPFAVILSLDIEVKVQDGRVIIEFTRLRRGSQELSISLAWAYFGSEFECLNKLGLFRLDYHQTQRYHAKF